MKNLIGLVKSAFENKNLVLDLEARQWCDSVGGVYFGYRMAFTTPDLSTWEVIHASREMQYGYGSHWLHVAAKDFTTLTGISCNGYDIERFFQASGIKLASNMVTVTRKKDLKKFIDSNN